jgi:hypothetical protein
VTRRRRNSERLGRHLGDIELTLAVTASLDWSANISALPCNYWERSVVDGIVGSPSEPAMSFPS